RTTALIAERASLRSRARGVPDPRGLRARSEHDDGHETILLGLTSGHARTVDCGSTRAHGAADRGVGGGIRFTRAARLRNRGGRHGQLHLTRKQKGNFKIFPEGTSESPVAPLTGKKVDRPIMVRVHGLGSARGDAPTEIRL